MRKCFLQRELRFTVTFRGSPNKVKLFGLDKRGKSAKFLTMTLAYHSTVCLFYVEKDPSQQEVL
jgi:hypothetical protein